MSGGVGTAEAPQQGLANLHAEELLQQTVDVGRFEAIPEHDGSLQRLIERYGDNPGSCPYIKSMGEAGIQLVQKLAEAEKNPDRGPTIRELMEAKKKEAQSQISDQDKPKAAKDTESVRPTKTERDTGKKSDEVLPPDKSVEQILAQEDATRIIVAEAIDSPVRPAATPISKSSERGVESLSEDRPNPVIIEAENILRQHIIELADRRRAEIEQIHSQTLSLSESGADPTIIQMTTIERPTAIMDPSEPARRVGPMNELAEQGVYPKTFDDTSSSIESSVEDADMAPGFVDSVIEEPLSEIDDLVAELGLEYSFPGIGDVIEEIEIENESLIDDKGLDLAPDVAVDIRDQIHETGNPVLVEVAKPIELRVELSAYIETLEPEKAEAAETVLQTLVEVLEVNQTAIENGEVISEVDVKKVEHLFTELLESLNPDYKDETVNQLMKNLFSSEIIAEITEDYELSIDQLNYLGTREYQSNSVASLLTSLIQMIKQKIEPHLRLGKYALEHLNFRQITPTQAANAINLK